MINNNNHCNGFYFCSLSKLAVVQKGAACPSEITLYTLRNCCIKFGPLICRLVIKIHEEPPVQCMVKNYPHYNKDIVINAHAH